MPVVRITNLGGINNKVQPFEKQDGELTRCVNMYTNQIGAKRKRPGYTAFLGTADGEPVKTLFNFRQENDDLNFLYRASGSILHFYDVNAGTGDWSTPENGTITDGHHVGHAVLNDVLILGDGAGSTRHTTNGTSFTNTNLAPPGEFFTTEYKRVFIGGTASDLFWSASNDATYWDTAGTSDTSSVKIDGPGKINGVFNSDDRVVATKTSGLMKRWDEYSLVTVPTKQGYTSPYSRCEIEGYHIGLTRPFGYFGYGGGRPELLSNQIEPQVYNNAGNGIAGTSFTSAPAGVNRYLYQCAVGTVTDGFTGVEIPDCVQVYNFQTDEWTNYQYAHFPTAFGNYVDSSQVEHFVFGDENGQVYRTSGTATSDAGQPIQAILEGFLHLKAPDVDKIWKEINAFASPGCQATLQIAATNTFDATNLNWTDAVSLKTGVAEFRYGKRGRFLFYRVHEYSADPAFEFYGFSIDVDKIGG